MQARVSARRHVAEDDTRRTAWDASQLDLSDVMSGGPLVLRNLFACGSAGAPRSSEPTATRPRYVTPPGAVQPVKVALPTLSLDPQVQPVLRVSARGAANRPQRFRARP